jgi:Zn-dependent peptidase ImmA (M78 family)
MTKSYIDAVHDYRRNSGNPYACIEDVEAYTELRANRLLLENPHAREEELLEFVEKSDVGDIQEPGITPRKKSKYSDAEVEEIARRFQRDLWKRHLRVTGKKPNPLELINPAAAFRVLGYEFEVVESLGEFSDQGGRVKVAGILDQLQKRVRISTQFPPAHRNFTAAHELGHALLHEQTGLHRDRSVDGTYRAVDECERTADRFGVFFLMPKRLVAEVFESIFALKQICLSDSDHLSLLSASDSAFRQATTLRELSRKLAGLTRFNGRSIVSLAETFNVSPGAMAIRLEELQLIVLS